MNKVFINIVKVIVMAIIIVGSIYYLGVLMRPTNTDGAINAIETFHDMPEDSIEVIAYGSSRVWRALDSMEMYENYGVGMYNYGCNWQHFNTTYLFLRDSLQTQSPEVVIIEVKNVSNQLENQDMAGEVYYTTAISGIDIKAEYLMQTFGLELDRYISYFWPIVAFHSNWKSLTEDNFVNNSSTYDFYATMGYLKGNSVTSIDPVDSSTFEELEINEVSLVILDNILEVCNEANIEIIFYVTPYSGEYRYSDAMAEYAEDNDCVYFDLFDYMDELEISWETDFQDANHLNVEGAKKVSDFFAEYIVDNYNVTDMRTIEGNIWELNLEE